MQWAGRREETGAGTAAALVLFRLSYAAMDRCLLVYDCSNNTLSSSRRESTSLIPCSSLALV